MSKKLSQNDVRQELANAGCVLTSTYIDLHSNLLFICHCSRKSSPMTLGNFRRKKQCQDCGKDASSKAKNKDYTDFRSGKLLAQYDAGYSLHGFRVWYCKCDCGGKTGYDGFKTNKNSRTI